MPTIVTLCKSGIYVINKLRLGRWLTGWPGKDCV